MIIIATMPDYNELHIATKGGDLVQVQSFVGNFDINAKGENDETALIIAAQAGYADIIQLLLSLNADVNIPNVSALKMISTHLISVSLSYISLFCTLLSTPFCTSNCRSLPRLVDVLPSQPMICSMDFLSL